MIKPLPKDLQDKAIEVLNEDPSRVEDDIRNIKEWMRQQPHLNGREDDQWILGFLRGCKFSLELTKSKLDNFYAYKSYGGQFPACRDPFRPDIQQVFKLSLNLPLPEPVTSTGPKILFTRINELDMDVIPKDSLLASLFMTKCILSLEDPNYAVSGVIAILDMANFPANSFKHFSLDFMRRFAFCLKSAVPLRLECIILINGSSVLEMAVNLFQSVLKNKLLNRVYMYSKENFHEIEKHVPIKCLPKEYGGEQISLDEIRDNWKKHVESYAEWFKEDEQYCTNEALRQGKSILMDEDGIDGSFRKLNVD